MNESFVSDINLNDFVFILLIALVATVDMWFVTQWLLQKKRKKSFILADWICFVLILLFGGTTLFQSVQKERKTWSRFFKETAQSYAGALEELEHWKIEFSFSEWTPSIGLGDKKIDILPLGYPRSSQRKLNPPAEIEAQKKTEHSIGISWKSAQEANQYELQRSNNPIDKSSWEIVYRGPDLSFIDDISGIPENKRDAIRYRLCSLFTTPEDDPLYLRLCKLLQHASDKSDYAAMFYTMRNYDDLDCAFIISPAIDTDGDGKIDPVSERPSPIGEVYPKTEVMKTLFDHDNLKPVAVVNTIPVSDDWGHWVTAFVPLFKPDETFDSVVGVDFPAELWTKNILLAQLRPAIFFFFVLGMFFVGTILIARLQCSQEEQAAATETLRQTVEELTNAKQSADVAARAKSNFLANMSHEIRTPMNAVLGFADILGRRLLECCNEDRLEENRQTVAFIEKSGSDLLTIINDILDFSKVDADQIDVESIPTSPHQIIEDVRHLIMVRLEEKPNLRVSIDIKDDVPNHIFSDPTRLRQILANLCGNAIKFSDQGELKISCRMRYYDNTPENREKIRTKFGNGVDLSVFDGKDQIKLLQFAVQDPGIGMTQEQVAKLFQPFSQADSSLTRRFGGTGLGLSISKRLAILLGGDIRVKSQENVGSTFTVTIAPKIPSRPIMNSYSGVFLLTDNEKPLTGFHFLLVEDGKVNQIVISTQLKEAGATVEIAENGQIGVDKVMQDAEGTFDAILMDMQMPVMDGYEATKYLRAHGFEKPIIAVTAHALSGDCEKTLEVGCNAYVSKPIDRNKLIDMILSMDSTAFGIG